MSDSAQGFRPRPRRPREGASKHDLENLRSALHDLFLVGDRLKNVNKAALDQRTSDVAMIAEYFVIRTDTFVGLLPREVTTRLDPADLRGLRDSRNIVAHDYFAVRPAILLDTVTVKIPTLLLQIQTLLAEDSEAPG